MLFQADCDRHNRMPASDLFGFRPRGGGEKGKNMNSALLILRLIVGLGFAAHGAQKLFGWFGGSGIHGTGAFFESIGFRPGSRFAVAAGSSELLGGLMLALGFAGPIGPALMISVMAVAILTVHKGRGFFTQNGGAELPLIYIASAVTVAWAGPGQYSIDHTLGLDGVVPRVWVVGILACGILAALGSLPLRHMPQPAP